MGKDVYHINKNIDRPLVFKGLKAQYIFYYLGVVVVSFILFALLNSFGVNTFLTLLIVTVFAFTGIKMVTVISDRFGKDGLMKHFAKGKIPPHLRIETRRYFLNLKKDSDGGQS